MLEQVIRQVADKLGIKANRNAVEALNISLEAEIPGFSRGIVNLICKNILGREPFKLSIRMVEPQVFWAPPYKISGKQL
jgi:ABC-type amino acid transport substrate-binding protein